MRSSSRKGQSLDLQAPGTRASLLWRGFRRLRLGEFSRWLRIYLSIPDPPSLKPTSWQAPLHLVVRACNDKPDSRLYSLASHKSLTTHCVQLEMSCEAERFANLALSTPTPGGIAAFSPTHYSSGETCVKAFHRFCVNDTCWQQVKDTRLDPSTNSLGHSYIKSCTVLGLSYGYAGVYLFTVPGCNRGAAAKLCSSCVCACLLHAACGRLFGSLRVCWA